MTEKTYKMTISLNVLNHLGINLYSNIPAVLSEVVANAWDADAKVVDISIESDKVLIVDDGCGMSYDDLNDKYLLVGYIRREQPNEAETPIFHRPVMGRKGIGKLSLFSIADTIEIQSMKEGVKNGFVMSAEKIQEQLKDKENHSGDYHPDPLSEDKITIDRQGTLVTIRNLKKGTSTTAYALRKRLARRFSIIGADYNFTVNIDGKPIAIEDRDYFHKVQYLWHYGENSEKYISYCRKDTLLQHEKRPNEFGENEYEVSGWIGSMAKAGLLKDDLGDNLNKIVIMVRGKLAQEDILEDFVEGGMYTKYLIGELHADFLDTDEGEDSATTSRQEIKKDDPRYVALKNWVLGELKNIQSLWTKLRNKEGTEWALQIPAIKEWFTSLGKDDRKHAESLFGKLNQLSIDSDAEKRTLLSHAVLAFESFRYKNNLSALENISIENIQAFSEIFANLDDIEATLYHQIIGERLEVVKALQGKIEDNVLEKVIQKYLYDHLWLLEPSWERATETPLLEQQVKTAFAKLDANLTKEEKEGRFDIKYKTTSKKHVIIELKRAERSISSFDIGKQVSKYRNALRKILIAAGKAQEPIEIVCIVGKPCSDWVDPAAEQESRDSLAQLHIRVVRYQELIEDSYSNYQAFLSKSEEVGRIYRLIRNIEEYNWGEV
jgi:hypothetical protein